MSEKTKESGSSIWSSRDFWLLIGLAIGMGLLVYRDAIFSSNILFTSDDNIGAIALRERWLPAGFWRVWDDSVLAGQPALLAFNWTNLLLWLLPVRIFQNIIHAADLAIATIGFGLFLRARGIRLVPALLGALTAFWLGSTFFLTYAGHIGKFGVVMFAGLAIWLIEVAVQRKSWAWGSLAGVVCGGMFLEQADVAAFFAIVLGPYAVYAVARDHGKNISAWLKPLIPMGVVALLVASRALWMATSFYAFETTDKPPESKQQVWEYVTQWSWPPEETIEWLAPGYFGWRSGEPSGPYWGRLGRSEGWDTTRQGFPNFKLETLYIGGIPIALALLGMVIGFKSKGRARTDTVFWSAALLLTFILGCGKFTPLYRLFFELPAMSSIRAPVKFMQVAQFALGVLAAFGLNGLMEQLKTSSKMPKRFLQIVLGCAGVLILWWAGLASSSATAAQKFAAMGWGNAGTIMASNQAWSIGHAGILLLLAVGVFWAMRQRSNLVWLLLALVAIDQLVVSRHYVMTTSAKGYIEKNAVVDFLKPRLTTQRLFLASQSSFYNQWLTVLFPYQGIPTYNAAQIRMPEDYQEFMEAMNSRPDRLWQYFAIGYVMGPGDLWPQLQNNPMFKGHFDLAYAFNVFPQGAGVTVVPATQQQPGQQIIAQLTAPAPRYALIAGWETADGSTTLARLKDASRAPFERVLVSPDADLPESSGNGLTGSITVQEMDTGRIKLKVASDVPAVLRASEKFTPYWKAWINGKPAEVFRTDHVFTGVFVGPGINTIELEHCPPRLTLLLQGAGLLIGLGAVFVCAFKREPESATA